MISDEAVEAAAKAFIEHGTLFEVLEAAAPHMLERAWDAAYQAALEDEGLGRTTTPNPYRSQA